MTEVTVNKAKKKLRSVLFSRTALIILLLLVQLGVMLVTATILRAYQAYLYGAWQIIGAIVIIYIINEKGNPVFNMTWVLLILVAPAFGCLFYIYVKSQVGTRKICRRLSKLKLAVAQYSGQDSEVIENLRKEKPANANLSHYMKYQLGFPTYQNTKAVYFPSGEAKLPAMLAELEKAEKFIFLEYFIVSEGKMWDAILEVLQRKAAAGVEVRFMYDGMCGVSLLPYDYPAQIQKLGIKCKMFSPLRPVLSTSQNNRDHRKVCVIDGRVAITGGINIGDEYINEKERFGYWKDTAIMLKGDAVQSFTMMFLQMWNATERVPEHYERYLTAMAEKNRTEDGYMLPYGDSPYDHEDVGEAVYMHILNHAKQYVHIMTPYLILDNEMLDALKLAAKSGIEVCIIMPHVPDKWYAFAVAKTYYKELLEAGVKIYEFLPGFVHAKVFVSDDDTATVGTINLDYRSLYLHFECGVLIYRNPVVQDIEQDYQATLKRCRVVTLKDERETGFFTKMCGRVLRILAPLM